MNAARGRRVSVARLNREGVLMAHRWFLSSAELAKSYAKAGEREMARRYGAHARREWQTVRGFLESGRCAL